MTEPFEAKPSARIIADSISPAGHRLTTMEVVMHRFVLAEFNTHRVFSRNSASSRAIPMSVTLKQYSEDPALPLVWPSEQPGMQGGAILEGEDREDAETLLSLIHGTTWNLINEYVTTRHPEHRLHKSVLNRYLEPFRWHTVVVSSTEWENFWRQRLHKDAMPEMRICAEEMKAAYDLSEPREIPVSGWHMPYIEQGIEILDWWEENFDKEPQTLLQPEPDWRKISVARCTRVSYDRQGEGSIDECLKLYNRLADSRIEAGDPEHSSPFEHVATPCIHRPLSTGTDIHLGNFRGWDQMRHQVFGR